MERHLRNIILGLLLIICISCNEENRESKLLYDIEIDYLSMPLDDKRDLPSDSVLICFAGNFNKDTMTVYVNNEFYNRSILTTDEVVGMAGDLSLPAYKGIKNIGLRINKGKLIFLETEDEHFNILLDFVDNKVTIRFYRKLPGFM